MEEAREDDDVPGEGAGAGAGAGAPPGAEEEDFEEDDHVLIADEDDDHVLIADEEDHVLIAEDEDELELEEKDPHDAGLPPPTVSAAGFESFSDTPMESFCSTRTRMHMPLCKISTGLMVSVSSNVLPLP